MSALDVNGNDLLAPPAADRVVSFSHVAEAVRRRWRAVVGLAAAGMLIGLALSVVVPKKHSATSALLLQFPQGADPARAMDTDLSLLQTRAVAGLAQKSLGLAGPPGNFLSQYHGVILSDGVMKIVADGPNSTAAVRRTIAVDDAFLAFRKQVYTQQLVAVVAALADQEGDLNKQIATVTSEIENFNPRTAPPGTVLDDLVSQRSGLDSQVQAIDATIQSDQIATTSIIQGSRIIDTASAVIVSARRTAALNAASGLIGGFAVGLGAVVLLAVASTRVRRRTDFAAALRAPVAVSVGRLAPSWWRRFATPRDASLAEPSRDMQLVVGHLRGALDAASTPALAIVAIDNLAAAVVVVEAFERQLRADGYRVSVVNESGRALPGGAAHNEPPADRNGAIPWNVVLVLAALDPMKGADHLKEWANDAVVLVTAGRSSLTKVEANGIMLRSANVRLRSAVLIGTDPTDDSLGIFEDRSVPTIGRRPLGLSDPASAKRSS